MVVESEGNTPIGKRFQRFVIVLDFIMRRDVGDATLMRNQHPTKGAGWSFVRGKPQ
jgi:hypothetical protein